MQPYGKKFWLIPDCYRPPVYETQKSQPYQSHDAICVLNTGDENAAIEITLYFEDREPSKGYSAVCPARRTNHIRMDRIRSASGEEVPCGIPYAALVESSCPIVVQYSRLDATQENNAMMTTIAWT